MRKKQKEITLYHYLMQEGNNAAKVLQPGNLTSRLQSWIVIIVIAVKHTLGVEQK